MIGTVKCTSNIGRSVRSSLHISPKNFEFKSGPRMVLNTQCYQYLWLSMWFHAKKSKETPKNSKSLILQCKFGSRAQKWPKIAKKNGSLNRVLLNFFVKVWYILDASMWILTSRRFRICVAKGGRGYFRPSYRRPKFTLISKKKRSVFAGYGTIWQLGQFDT